jgi:hypothetical protein
LPISLHLHTADLSSALLTSQLSAINFFNQGLLQVAYSPLPDFLFRSTDPAMQAMVKYQQQIRLLCVKLFPQLF